MALRTATVLLLALVIASCSSETRESEHRREASARGYRVEVLKKDSYTQYKGLLTGHDYGTRHEYTYSFELSPGRISWSGGSAEPKTLLFCPDQIYLRYLDIELEQPDAGVAQGGLDAAAKGGIEARTREPNEARTREPNEARTRKQNEVRAREQNRESAAREQNSESAPRPTMKAVARQAKLRDERTFFKLFGELRWITIDPSEVPATGDCHELAVPNDNELALGKPVLEP